jgi:hypothetical protein
VPGGIIAATVSAGKLAHVSPDGRFFESYGSEDEIRSYLESAGFATMYLATEIVESTTYGGATYGKWAMFIAKEVNKTRVA